MSNLKKGNTVENVSNFTPYGTDPKKDKMVKSNNWKKRLKMVEESYGLNILVNDKDWVVREAVANQGYGLDILINDEDYDVRRAVAYQGYGLGILVNDKHDGVRRAVANQGYGLDVLIKDKNWSVRKAVAKQGYGLDILVNDEDWAVRAAVADQGYGLDVLINDKDNDVREAVLYYLKKNNLTLAEWYNKNNKEIDLRKLAFSPYPEARIAAIESGYVYKESEMYIAPDCKFTPYGTDSEKDKMVKSDYSKNRFKMAKEGYGLNVLINDEDYDVRGAIANQGYGLNILINDKNWYVRRAIAEQGYGLDILVNDEYCSVRRAVKKYLTSHNLTLEQWKSNQDLSETNIINQAKNAISDGKINIKNVADNIKSTESILNDSINKTNKTNEIDKSL